MFPDFLENPSDVAAPLLLGCTLTRTITLNGEKHKLVAKTLMLQSAFSSKAMRLFQELRSFQECKTGPKYYQ